MPAKERNFPPKEQQNDKCIRVVVSKRYTHTQHTQQEANESWSPQMLYMVCVL
jgi:hypothetical protein